MALRALTLRRLVFRRFDDETLLAHVLEGQESAFSELHQRYRTIVYGYCLARLMDPSAAEDVTQDTFMRIHGARSHEPIRSARAWIFSVTRSALVDHVRRQKRQPSYLSAEEELAVISPGSDAAETAERREQAQSVFLAIARLRPRYRSALLLREMHGLSSVEIGEAMNLKPGAVDTLVSRARDAFGKEYANLGDLPATCRRAVEYMYRERGTGIDADERMWLGDHVAGCARCARERGTATDARGLAMLLPLIGARDGGFGFLTRAVETLGWAPASVDALSSLAAKATVVVIATAIAVSPIGAPRTASLGRDDSGGGGAIELPIAQPSVSQHDVAAEPTAGAAPTEADVAPSDSSLASGGGSAVSADAGLAESMTAGPTAPDDSGALGADDHSPAASEAETERVSAGGGFASTQTGEGSDDASGPVGSAGEIGSVTGDPTQGGPEELPDAVLEPSDVSSETVSTGTLGP
jgi:RNA polymerase sigma-70 factor (ECF subfamily)